MSSLLMGERFVAAYPNLVRALGGDLIAALTLQAINYRSNIIKPDENGEIWVDLRMTEIADEIGISKHQVQRAMARLRGLSLLMEKQAPGYNNMKLWAIDESALDDLEKAQAQNLENAPAHLYKSDSALSENAPAQDYKSDSAVSTYIEEDIRSNKKDKNLTTRTYGDENHQACNLLADLIADNGSRRPEVTDKWLSDMDKLHRIDERSWEQITKAIQWCQADDFWRGNIMSPAKLRKQYDQLRLAAQRGNKTSKFTKTMDWLKNLENETKELGQ